VQPVPRENAQSPVPVASGVLTTSGTWGSANPVSNNDSLQAQLKARGVLYQKEDRVPEGVRVSCIVASRQNPSITRVYEAVARDYPSAVQAVLKQLDQQR
jgi:hypothetical protein